MARHLPFLAPPLNCWQQLLITVIARMLLVSTCPKSEKMALPLQWRGARTRNRAVAEAGIGGRARIRPEDEDAAEARAKLKPQQGSNSTVNFKNGLQSSEWCGRPTIRLGNSQCLRRQRMKNSPQGFQPGQISKQDRTDQNQGCEIRVCLEGDSEARRNVRV